MIDTRDVAGDHLNGVHGPKWRGPLSSAVAQPDGLMKPGPPSNWSKGRPRAPCAWRYCPPPATSSLRPQQDRCHLALYPCWSVHRSPKLSELLSYHPASHPLTLCPPLTWLPLTPHILSLGPLELTVHGQENSCISRCIYKHSLLFSVLTEQGAPQGKSVNFKVMLVAKTNMHTYHFLGTVPSTVPALIPLVATTAT